MICCLPRLASFRFLLSALLRFRQLPPLFLQFFVLPTRRFPLPPLELPTFLVAHGPTRSPMADCCLSGCCSPTPRPHGTHDRSGATTISTLKPSPHPPHSPPATPLTPPPPPTTSPSPPASRSDLGSAPRPHGTDDCSNPTTICTLKPSPHPPHSPHATSFTPPPPSPSTPPKPDPAESESPYASPPGAPTHPPPHSRSQAAPPP